MKLYHSFFSVGRNTHADYVFTDLKNARDYCVRRVEYLKGTPLSYYINISEMEEMESGAYMVKKVVNSWSRLENGKIREH